MRKGARRRDWTVYEERYLADAAGTVPKREICRRLRRSSKSVECKAAAMRRAGVGIELRCHVSRLRTCPSCGCLRSRHGSEGICEPCRRRAQLAAIHGRIADLLAELPPEERAVYETTEAETQSAVCTMPAAPDVRGMSRYRAARALDDYEVAMEDWAAANLRRQVKAAQKRKERIEKKVRSMRVSEKHQEGEGK